MPDHLRAALARTARLIEAAEGTLRELYGVRDELTQELHGVPWGNRERQGMSYEAYLHHEDGSQVSVTPFMGGGTVQVNPDTMEEIPQVTAELNITYNYSLLFDLAAKAALYDLLEEARVPRSQAPSEQVETLVALRQAQTTLEGIIEVGLRFLDGKVANELRDALERMLAQLDPHGRARPHDDYWAPTPGNVATTLRTLVSWCHQAPDAHFTLH